MMDPDARFRSPVALRAARRHHTLLDAVLLVSLLVFAALTIGSTSTSSRTACEGSVVQAFCSAPVTSDGVRPS